jgi:hypothetical protein
MAWFRCFLRGEHFPGELVGEAGPIGFYVTRFVSSTFTAQAGASSSERRRRTP